MQLGRPPNRIDVLTTISGVEFSDAWDQRVPATMDSVPVFFISKKQLLLNKEASGRPKDFGDISKLKED